MTYADLLKELENLDPSRLLDTVTLYDNTRDEFYAVKDFQIAVGDLTDILDDGHAYLEF